MWKKSIKSRRKSVICYNEGIKKEKRINRKFEKLMLYN